MKTLLDKLDRWGGKFKLQPKLLIIFYFVSFVPLLTLAAFFYFISTEILKDELGAYMVGTTKQVDQRLSSFLEEMNHLTSTIHFNDSVQNFLDTDDPYEQSTIENSQRLRQFLDNITHHRARLDSVYVINDYGKVIHSSKSSSVFDYDFLGDPWYVDRIKEEGFHLLPVKQHAFARGKSSFTYMGRLNYFSQYREQGTLLLNFDPQYLSEMTDSIKLGDTGFVFMLTNDRKPVTSVEKENEEIISKLSSLSMYKEDSGYSLMTINDVLTLVSFSTSKETGWKIVGVVPFHEVSAKIKTISYGIVAFCIIGIIFILIFSKYLSQVITRPLFRLQESMERVEQGDFTFQVPMDRGDELGDLSRHFNHMLKKLEHLKEEVYLAGLRETKLQLLNRESELHALQMQINPHFLYNTLNTMKCVGEVYEVKEVYEMSESLSIMFKYSIDGEKYKLIDEELDHVRAYLNIISIRFPDSIDCHIDIPQYLKEIPVLKLILQPLVENAIEHGLLPKGEKGNIWISAESKEDLLILQVKDDGVGILKDKLIQIRNYLTSSLRKGIINKEKLQSNHIGLNNVQQRLYHNYGKKGKLNIKSNEKAGTVIEITIPLHGDSVDS
ncbi:sensor histidine kinase [Metabacillus niabensis]|uniref:sensor histidine kinase n=1 Tax=Metabacillus niabensis TaxID=324854 RepID=UPI001CF99B24|nr:histidine kinase [Metabacillus niabensis]